MSKSIEQFKKRMGSRLDYTGAAAGAGVFGAMLGAGIGFYSSVGIGNPFLMTTNIAVGSVGGAAAGIAVVLAAAIVWTAANASFLLISLLMEKISEFGEMVCGSSAGTPADLNQAA